MESNVERIRYTLAYLATTALTAKVLLTIAGTVYYVASLTDRNQGWMEAELGIHA